MIKWWLRIGWEVWSVHRDQGYLVTVWNNKTTLERRTTKTSGWIVSATFWIRWLFKINWEKVHTEIAWPESSVYWYNHRTGETKVTREPF